MNLPNIDLSKYKYEIELHAHSGPVSPCSGIPPRRLVGMHKERGLDGVAVTNHFYPPTASKFGSAEKFAEWYNNDYFEALDEGAKLGIRVYFGIEFFIEPNDYLIFGVNPDETASFFDYLSKDLAALKNDLINDGRKIIIQAHPFRGGCHPADASLLDGIEIMNNHPGHNSKPGNSCLFGAEHPDKIMTCGSDLHIDSMLASGTIITKELPEDSVGLAKMLKKREHLLSSSGQLTIPVSFGIPYSG